MYKISEEYIDDIPDDRKESFLKILNTIRSHIPKGFHEEINYNMIGFVVPKSIYVKGYHCNPTLPLPFLNIANQKNYIALYHLGLYCNKDILNWFKSEYKIRCKYKLDIGKSCIRFKYMNDIPLDLIAELVSKLTVDQWITYYEQSLKGKS